MARNSEAVVAAPLWERRRVTHCNTEHSDVNGRVSTTHRQYICTYIQIQRCIAKPTFAAESVGGVGKKC
jgi:hypothetical protein